MCVFRYKQIAAERLAIAGLHVAYGFTDFPTNGPFPINIALAQPEKVCTGCSKQIYCGGQSLNLNQYYKGFFLDIFDDISLGKINFASEEFQTFFVQFVLQRFSQRK